MITVNVLGSEKLVGAMRGLYPEIMTEVRKTTESLAVQLLRYVKDQKLSGMVLKNRTGTLRRSINYKVTNSGTESKAIVGTNKEYAAAHEYGFHGTVNVKEHLRMMKKAWGKEMRNPRQVLVRAHSMTMNLPERSFLRSALEDVRPNIVREYESAVQRVLNKAELANLK